jgi:hypothetical protein
MFSQLESVDTGQLRTSTGSCTGRGHLRAIRPGTLRVHPGALGWRLQRKAADIGGRA